MNQYPGTNYHDLNLNWLVGEMKKCLAEWAETQEDWNNLLADNTEFKAAIEQEWDDFKNYLTETYLPQNIEADVAAYIAEMAEDGSLLDIITRDEGDGSALSDVVGEWLRDNLTPTEPPVDPTLSMSGAAADAKVTGDKISELKTSLNSLEGYTGVSKSIFNAATPGYILYEDGTAETGSTAISDGYVYGNPIEVKQGAVINYKLRVPSRGCMIAYYSDSMVYDASKSVAGTGGAYEGVYNVPADGYVILSTRGDVTDKYATYSTNGELNTKIDTVDGKTVLLNEKIFSLVGAETVNGFLKTNGTVQDNDLYRTTDYLPVSSGQTIRYNLGHATTLPVLCFYTSKSATDIDTTKTITGINGYVSGTFTVSANGYIRATFYASKTESALDFTSHIPDNVIKYINDNVQANILSGKNILCLGDSIFGNDGEIVADIHTLTGANSINCAFGGTRVTDRGSGDFRYFDGVQLVSALCSQTWTDQDSAAESLESSYPWITSRLATLKSVDMSEIDIITMNWGTNDYTAGATIEQINTAYNTVIDLLQETYPAIRILIITPIWRYFGAKIDNENGDNKIYNVSTLKQIATAIDENSKNKRIESLQMYQKMPLSYNTADLYFDANDSTHLNTSGNMVYSHILVGKLRSMY